MADPVPAHPISPERSATPSLTDAQALLDFLNRKTDPAYRPVHAHLTLILDRLREGAMPSNHCTEKCPHLADCLVYPSRQADLSPYASPISLPVSSHLTCLPIPTK